jgi:hypothetical protein
MVTTLALLLCSLVLAAEPPPPPAGPSPPPPAAPEDWDETSPPASGAPTVAPAPAAPAESSLFTLTMVGVEVMVPRKASGRLLEQPVSVVFEGEHRLAAGLVAGIHGSIGYAQLSRTEACGSDLSCAPLLSVSLGGVLRATTPPGGAVVGWIALGVGIGGATGLLSDSANILGVYGRADAGVDLGAGSRKVRLSVGWVQATYTETSPDREPGPQQYLAFTLAIGSR